MVKSKLPYVAAAAFVIIPAIILAFLYMTSPDNFAEIDINRDMGPLVFRFVYGGHYMRNNETYVYARESSDPGAQIDILHLAGNYSTNFSQLIQDIEIEATFTRDAQGNLYLVEIKD